MTALASTDLTVVISEMVRMGTRKKLHRGTMAFGNASLTYPTAGVPLPAIGAFGFTSQMDTLQIFGNNARTTDYKYDYNKAAHKLLMYEEEGAAAGGPLLECDTSEAPAARTLDWVAIGW